MSNFVGDERVAQFVERELGVNFIPPFTTMGVEKDGEIIGGVVFNIFENHDVHATVAGRGFGKAFLADVGQYVYATLNKERITVITEQPKVVRLAQKLGGQLEGCLRNHFGRGRDAFVAGILKEEYRF